MRPPSSLRTALGVAAASLVVLPDDPVLALVTLFGLASLVLVAGAGPYAVDGWVRDRTKDPGARRMGEAGSPGD